MIRILKLFRPIQLLLASMTYLLGAGIARYFGYKVNLVSIGFGLLAVLSLLAASSILIEYFHMPLMSLAQDETPRQKERCRVLLLQVSYASLTLSAVSILILLLSHLLNLSAGILLFITIILMMAYAIPPMHLFDSGYGDLVMAVTLGTIIPAMAFMLQSDQLHRLLSFTTFPLTLLALAYMIISSFPTYATDLKLGRHTLLTRLSWQRAIPIHHFLILTAFLLFAVAPLLGYPWGLVWPVFTVLPFTIFQMFWLQRIANGGRPLWNFLIALANATFGLTIYALALTFWIR